MMKSSMMAGLVALTLAFSVAPPAAAAEEIPTSVTGGGTSQYPDPICTTCKVKTRKNPQSSTSATIELVYTDSAPFEGDIMVTVWFDSQSSDQLAIRDVELAYDDEASFVVQANQGWDWDDVVEVELEMLPL